MPKETTETAFDHKCHVLGELWLFYRDSENEGWIDFFAWADLGLPIAHLHWSDLVIVKDDGKALVEETWEAFCEMIAIDPQGTYTNLAEAFEASPNPPVVSDEDDE